jgi:hypothetical protein
MTTATDDGPLAEVECHPVLPRQPLGFLPTRQFWRDPENGRLAWLPVSICVFVLIFTISALLDPPWWVAFLLFPAAMVLSQGLLERYVRRAALRRCRSQLAALAEDGGPSDHERSRAEVETESITRAAGRRRR